MAQGTSCDTPQEPLKADLPKYDLTIGALRKRLARAASEIGDPYLEDAARDCCLDPIIEKVYASGRARDIVSLFLDGYPDKEKIMAAIFAFPEPEISRYVAQAIGYTAYGTEDPEAIRSVTECFLQDEVKRVFKEYKGLGGRERVAQAIGYTAYYTRDPEAVKRVTECFLQDEVQRVFEEYKGLGGRERVAQAIRNTACNTRDPEAVKRVAETLLAYKGLEGREETGWAIENTACETRDPEAVKRVAEKYLRKLRPWYSRLLPWN